MIITLPFTVKNDAPLGYWLTPVVADALSRQIQERGIFYYGTLGLRKPNDVAEKRFHHNLDFLNVQCERRTDGEIAPELVACCDQLSSVRKVRLSEQDCYCCPCGCLELPVQIATFAKEKTFFRVNGAYVCKVCNKPGTIRRIKNNVLELMPQDSCVNPCIYPAWYRKEFEELQRQIKEQGIPWSNKRQAELCGGYDPELVWSLIPFFLSRKYPAERIRIVVTNHVIRQAITTIQIARALDSSFEADLVILPCVDHPGSSGKWNLERLMSLGFSGELLRFILVSSLGWQSKNARLYDSASGVEYRRFQLFQKQVDSAKSNLVPYTLQEAFRNLSQQNLAKGLKHVFNPENFDYQSLTGVL